MLKYIKILVLLLPSLLFAFNSDNNDSVYNFYDFQNLKQANSPVKRKIIRIENISKNIKMIEDGFLITYKNPYAGSVKIGGDFSQWDPVNMMRSRYGIWYYFIKNHSNKRTTRYKFNVDGIWVPDPLNTDRQEDSMGSYVSVLRFRSVADNKLVTYRVIGQTSIEFRIHNPEAEFVALAGDFNNWNTESDKLSKDENNVWSLRKKLTPGIYRYIFIIDGKWTIDLYNEKTAVDDTGAICSLIEVGN